MTWPLYPLLPPLSPNPLHVPAMEEVLLSLQTYPLALVHVPLFSQNAQTPITLACLCPAYLPSRSVSW